MDHLKLIALKDFPLVKPLDNLSTLIIESIKLNKIDIEDGDVIIIAQKIVSKRKLKIDTKISMMLFQLMKL